MYSHTAGLDDPKFTGDRAARGEGKKIAQAIVKQTQGGWAAKFQNYNTCSLFGRKTQDLTKVAIQCDQRAALRHASLKHRLVRTAREPLLVHGRHVMTFQLQEVDSTPSNVLIDLDSHTSGSTGIGIIRSREASAP